VVFASIFTIPLSTVHQDVVGIAGNGVKMLKFPVYQALSTGAIICLKETHEYKEYGVFSPVSPLENDSLAGLFFVYHIVSLSFPPYNAEA
jgi:hypothetical protein